MRKFKVYKLSVEKVKNPLPVPTICPNCSSSVELISNSKIYRKEIGEGPFAYRCTGSECQSYVGIHPKTDIPLGTLADEKTRKARSAAKAIFQPMWEIDGFTKDSAYAWLAEKMGIKHEHCHVGWFNFEQCNQVIEICKKQREIK